MSELTDRIDVITDLLMGAAHADGSSEGREEEAVRKLLGEVLGDAKLPAEIDERIAKFDPKAFDLKAAAARFADDDLAGKRRLLELVDSVGGADAVIDSQEDDYLVALAEALGLQKEEYADLALDIQELRQSFDDVRRTPPPMLLTKKKP